MRFLLILLLSTTSLAQHLQPSHTTESLRGVSAVSNKVAWASGTHGTYLRTTDGEHWTPAQVSNAATLDFRGVVAFSADEAFLMSSGPDDQSRIYHTTDAGQHWQLQFSATNPKSFFDSIAFQDKTHGIVLGDPIPDETGKLKFQLLVTDDGQTWRAIPPATLPAAAEGEGAFAASNSCIAIVPSTARWKSGASEPRKRSGREGGSALDPNIWFATGGKVARVFHSPNGGQTWNVTDAPISHGPDSAGVFSIAFRDALHGIIAGGDYKHPDEDGPNLAFTEDGGKTWTLASTHPQPYFSAIAYDRQSKSKDLFLVASDVIFDYRPPSTLNKIDRLPNTKFNAISSYPEGGALVVGPNGSIVTIP